MSTIEVLSNAIQFNRIRTLALLDKIDQDANPAQALAWRPGSGRAHIGWQLMHIGITEELFATERLRPEKPAKFTELWPRFRGGSTPDDNVPASTLIRQVLGESRTRLLETLSHYSNAQLNFIPPAFKERGLTFHDILHIIAWHEGHHQGQSHITFNLYENRQA